MASFSLLCFCEPESFLFQWVKRGILRFLDQICTEGRTLLNDINKFDYLTDLRVKSIRFILRWILKSVAGNQRPKYTCDNNIFLYFRFRCLVSTKHPKVFNIEKQDRISKSSIDNRHSHIYY